MGVTYLEPRGRLTIADSKEAVKKNVESLLKAGHRKVIINLANVAYIDSSGIGELITVRNEILEAGGRVAFLNPSKQVDEILRITKLNSVLELYYSEMEAKGAVT